MTVEMLIVNDIAMIGLGAIIGYYIRMYVEIKQR